MVAVTAASFSGPIRAQFTEKPPVLLAEAQLRYDRPVTLDICLIEVRQLPTASAHHLQEASSGVVIFAMDSQVLREVIDPLRQSGDLNFSRARIGLVHLVFLNYFSFALLNEHSDGLSLPHLGK